MLGDLVEGVRLGLLRRVRVLRTAVHLELGELLTADAVLGQHAADGLLDRALRVLREELVVRDGLESARVAGVAVRLLLLELLTRQGDLVGVDDDDEVTGVDVVREGGLVLAAEERRRVRGEASEDHVGGVDDEPLAGDFTGLGGVCARHSSAAFLFERRCS